MPLFQCVEADVFIIFVKWLPIGVISAVSCLRLIVSIGDVFGNGGAALEAHGSPWLLLQLFHI